MNIKIVTVFVTLFLFSSTPHASSNCNCKGEAKVLKRNKIPSASKYTKKITDPKREEFEKVLSIIPKTLSCKGHSCCVAESTIMFVQKQNSNRPPAKGFYPTVLKGGDTAFNSLKAGKQFKFTFSCWDGLGPNGAIGAADLQIVSN